MKKRGNFKILSGFDFCIPDIPGLIILALLFGAGAVLSSLGSAVVAIAFGKEVAISWGMLICYPLMFIPPMIYASLKSKSASFMKEGRALDSFHSGDLAPWAVAVMVALATFCAAFLSDALNKVLPQMPEMLKEALESMTSGNFFLNFTLVSVFAPFFEEWLCRGMVLRSLLNYERKGGRRGIAPVWAIIISAAFFALIHGNLWQAVPAFLLGCLFGYVYYRTGSLKLTMLMHFVNNTVSLICGQIDSIKDYDFWYQIIPGRTYWIMFAALALLLIMILRKFSAIRIEEGGSNCNRVDFSDVENL